MANDEEVREIIVVERMDPAEQAILQEVGEDLNKLDTRQKKLLAGLRRLYHSLRGPEEEFDEAGYSRPIPPRHIPEASSIESGIQKKKS